MFAGQKLNKLSTFYKGTQTGGHRLKTV